MDYQSDKRPAQLENEELERMQTALRDVDTITHMMAELILDRVHGSDRRRSSRLAQATVVFDNSKFVVSDGENCGVYEEPPGWCRECTAQEAEQVSHA
jgi:hypothetical protein